MSVPSPCLGFSQLLQGLLSICVGAADTAQLVREYLTAGAPAREAMARRYGRRFIDRLAQESRSEAYVKENSKPCPGCTGAIEVSLLSYYLTTLLLSNNE